jgi:hypothetical protein
LLQAAMLVGKRINKPILQMVENAFPFRRYYLFCGVPWIPVVDVSSPGHSSEAKAGCLDLPAKNFSSMKSNCMAYTFQMKAYR